MTTWTILDYGVGNLHSLSKALAAAGAKIQVTQRPQDLARADVAVLPGVGAFGAVMDQLAPAGPALRLRHAEKRPTLGICIGAQVMYAASDETLGSKGLALFPGTVKRLPASAGKVPHMGWNTLDDARDPIFDDVPAGSHVYYVHGYAAPPGPETTATTTYGNVFTAALRQGATVGLQFHPEKSSAVGQRILRNVVQDLERAA
jgi:imidazole glycerol-phosphate synthase subunit HisH